MNIENINKILFIGIGGIGMSALARYYIARGIQVYGFDKTETELTREITKLGAIITYIDDLEYSQIDFDAIVYTPAIPSDSILFNYFKKSGKPLLKRSEALGIITKNMRTIAIAGSHGKTTVSTMIAVLLRECGIDCSAFLGGISTNFNSNYILGESNFVVIEADEFDKSFLQLNPEILVLTSIDTDHLDIYGTREKIVESFQEFINLLPKSGTLISSENVKDAINTIGSKSIYGFQNGEIIATDIKIYNTYSTFKINSGEVEFKINFNGRHNIENALAAITVGKKLNISETALSKALENFKGIKRRFEIIHKDETTLYIDDYAHHPTEIEALIGSIREIYPTRKILSIFQPHLFSRTKDLCEDFAKALDLSDEIILLPIYPARELPMEGVTSELISKKVHKPISLVDKADVISILKSRSCEIILTIGAGDISTLVNDIKNIYSE